MYDLHVYQHSVDNIWEELFLMQYDDQYIDMKNEFNFFFFLPNLYMAYAG